MKTSRGFTQIELMVVVAIIAILAAIAIPSYLNQVRKGRRSDAEQAMQQIAMLEEKFRADCPAYSSVAFGAQTNPVNCTTDPVGANPYMGNGTYYNIVPSGASATGYTLTASAIGGQGNDKAFGVVCTPLTYVVAAGVTTKSPPECWAQ